MSLTMNPAYIPGRGSPFLDQDEAFLYRLRMVLETRPGQLPWRPDFGCDLGPLLGQACTPQRIAEARWRIESALRRWLPDLELVSCRVRCVTQSENARPSPSPESGLLGLGTQVGLVVDMALREGGAVRTVSLPEPLLAPWSL